MRSTPRSSNLRLLAATLLFCLAAPLRAGEPDLPDYRSWQALDQKLFETGWRLVTRNAEFCSESVPSLGMALHDMATYPDPALTRSTFGLSGDIGVLAVAEDSPANRAGIVPDSTLASVNEAMVDHFPRTDPPWQRLDDLRDAMAIELQLTAPPVVGWTDPQGLPHGRTIAPVAACATRFEVGNLGERATADGSRVMLGPDFPGFAYPEDEFAAAVAHELAHNLLGHRAWLDTEGRSRSNIRLTEREADRLSPWLLINAGYDPTAAGRMIARLRPNSGGGLFRKRTHRGWDERVETIAFEIEAMEAHVDEGGRADWSQHFVREIGS